METIPDETVLGFLTPVLVAFVPGKGENSPHINPKPLPQLLQPLYQCIQPQLANLVDVHGGQAFTNTLGFLGVGDVAAPR